MANKPRKNYDEDYLWERAVRKAQAKRVKIEAKKKARKRPARARQVRIEDLQDDDEKVGELPAEGYMPWEKPDWDPAVGEDWNAELEKPQERVTRILTAKKSKTPQSVIGRKPMSKTQRNLLFMNPGDNKISEAIVALTRGGLMPEWTDPFRKNLHAKDGTLFFRDDRVDLPFAYKDEKRHEVKALYFNPKEPSTIQPITDELRDKFCNISRGNVTNILRSLETYQRNFGRRLPPQIASRTMLKQPGILAMDMFFPSDQLGWWGKFSCLACMDTWSRFCRCYALERKDYDTVSRAMNMFLQEFAAFGFLPRRILADKGTDLAPAAQLMERYRQDRDRDTKLVLHSKTGQPVLIVEALNAQLQRRMQVFRTARLTDDPSVILEDITDQINNQKRPERGNLTPLQLLSLNGAERAMINEKRRDRLAGIETDLKALKVGNHVRILMWDRKQQVKGGLGARFKGFAPKWSKRTYTVLKRTAMRRNPGVFTYYVGRDQVYYRHELLKIPRVVDTDVPQGYIEHRQNVVVPEDEDWGNQDDIPSEDSF